MTHNLLADSLGMARHEMTLRIFRILSYLETTRAGLRVGEIHQRLKDDGIEIDPRTIHRDIQLLQSAQIPLESEGRGSESRWKMAPFAKAKPNVQFTYPEVFALYVARKSLDHLKGSPLHETLNSLFMKIEKVLGDHSEVFQEFIENLSFRPQFTWHTTVPQVILDTVYQAIEEGHPLKINYRAEAGSKAGVHAERLVGPECLYFANGGIYLIAKDLAKGEPRSYALARMSSAEMDTSTPYEKQGLSPEVMYKDSFGFFTDGILTDVEILVEGPIAGYVSERKWHASQKAVRTDKGVKLSLKVHLSDELVRWVLSLGSGATVLAPSALSAMVEKMALQVAGNYNRKAG